MDPISQVYQMRDARDVLLEVPATENTLCDYRPGKHRLKNETGVSSAQCYGENYLLIILLLDYLGS